MHILWSSHIKDDEEREEFKKYIENSVSLLDRLSDIIDMKVNSAETARVSEKDYKLASWAFRQADLNGYIRAWNEMKALTKRKD